MNTSMDEVVSLITTELSNILATNEFKEFIAKFNPTDNDKIFINNSFVYREKLVDTSKNTVYICFNSLNNGQDFDQISISKPNEFNVDFKHYSSKSNNIPTMISLTDSISTELDTLGYLVFILIGNLKDDSVKISVKSTLVKQLQYSPFITETSVAKNDDGEYVVTVNQLNDQASAWISVSEALSEDQSINTTELSASFCEAFSDLCNKVRCHLILPNPSTPQNSETFISRLRESVSYQCAQYEKVLSEMNSSSDGNSTYSREVMRIAYNFANDAINILSLLVSISDLKPIIHWCTIYEHFKLAQAFKHLPWTTIPSNKKPDIELYQTIIGSARNNAFHNLFAFDRTIEADLTGIKVNAKSLTILPPYKDRLKTVMFDFEDREILEVLRKLTRAPESIIPPQFWEMNLYVMKAFESLLEATENALWVINRCRKN